MAESLLLSGLKEGTVETSDLRVGKLVDTLSLEKADDNCLSNTELPESDKNKKNVHFYKCNYFHTFLDLSVW